MPPSTTPSTSNAISSRAPRCGSSEPRQPTSGATRSRLCDRLLRFIPFSLVDRLDVLVNNAGLISPDYCLSEDGFELTFAVNHLAPFLLTNLLLNRLKASAPARVITVASRAHRGSR